MAWNLETAKTYLKIDPADTSMDAVIQQTLNRVLTSVETLLGRYLLRRRETIVFRGVVSPTMVQVERFPIKVIHRCTGAGDFSVHKEHGLLSFLTGTVGDVSLDMEGGYDPLPDDLEYAMWGAFISAWQSVDQTTGGPPADQVVTTGSGEVKSLTVFDAFKVDYDIGATSSSDDSGASDEANWGWLAPWASTLSQYRGGPAGAGLGIA